MFNGYYTGYICINQDLGGFRLLSIPAEGCWWSLPRLWGHREGAALLLFLDCITQLPDGKPPSPGAIKWIKKWKKKNWKKKGPDPINNAGTAFLGQKILLWGGEEEIWSGGMEWEGKRGSNTAVPFIWSLWDFAGAWGGDLTPPGFINKQLCHVGMGKEGIQVKPSGLGCSSLENRREGWGLFGFLLVFEWNWAQKSPSKTFKNISSQRERTITIKINRPVKNGDFTEYKLSLGVDASFPAFP